MTILRFNGFPVIYLGTTTQKVAVGATHAETPNAIGARVFRVIANTDCHLATGSAPVATTTDPLIPANVPEYFAINPAHKVSVIRDAADGYVWITPAG